MERVSFEGVTGPIDLHTGDSNGVYGAHSYRGDRQVGVVYDVKNVDASGQLVTVGKWAPCATCSFAQRWKQVAPLVYSTGGATPPRPEYVLVADPSSNSAGLIIAIVVSATFGLTLAVLLSWRRIVNISVKKIEQWWGLPAVKKSNEAEEERKCCSFWFVPADFVVELAEAIGEAAGAEGEKSELWFEQRWQQALKVPRPVSRREHAHDDLEQVFCPLAASQRGDELAPNGEGAPGRRWRGAKASQATFT